MRAQKNLVGVGDIIYNIIIDIYLYIYIYPQ